MGHHSLSAQVSWIASEYYTHSRHQTIKPDSSGWMAGDLHIQECGAKAIDEQTFMEV